MSMGIPLEKITLETLKPAAGATRKEKRVGRGRGSGHGDRATRGNKGAQSRSGYRRRPGFEGGQMPLQRRVPKRGFRPFKPVEYEEVRIDQIAQLPDTHITPELLKEKGLISANRPVVVVGSAFPVSIEHPIQLEVHRITRAARSLVEGAGGSVTILELPPQWRRVKKGPKRRIRARLANTRP
ncbi:MAG: 50S ribosomal protein L15 [bacterium]